MISFAKGYITNECIANEYIGDDILQIGALQILCCNAESENIICVEAYLRKIMVLYCPRLLQMDQESWTDYDDFQNSPG